MRNSVLFVFLSLFLISPVTSVFAQDPSFEVTVDSNTISLQEVMQLTMTVRGGDFATPPKLPDIDGFEAQYRGPSVQYSIVNGQASSMSSHMFVLIPHKTGKFQIPAISVDIGGKTLTSQPIDVEVTDQPTAAGGSSAGAASVDISDKLFATLSVPRDEVFMNEKVPVTIKLFVNNLPMQDIQYPQLELNGAIADEGFEHQQGQQVVGGVQYQVIEFKTYIYPTREGEIKLGPAKVTCGLMFESRQAPRSRDEFFGDEFFNRFFNSYEKRPFTATTSDVTVKALPFPKDNAPADFSGAVGQFNFEASAGPAEVTLGDPVTLRMKVTGDGNLKNVKLPVLNSPNFKVYDPQIKDEKGARVLEQIIVPQSDSVTEVPPLTFSFFDPFSKSFKTVTQGPFPIKVNKPKPGEDFKMLQFSGPGGKPAEVLGQENLGADIIFIKDHPGDWRDLAHPWYTGWGYRSLLLLVLLVWSGLVTLFQWTHRLSTDQAFARRLSAPKKARKKLDEAKGHISANRAAEFYDLLFKTLQEYFGDKFHLPVGGITYAVVEERLAAKKAPPAILGNVKGIFDDCDMVRYAGNIGGAQKMEQSLRQMEEIIDFMERNFR